MAEMVAKQPRSYQRTGLYVKASRGLVLRDKKVTRLTRRMRNIVPWLEDSDAPACRRWAELEVLIGQAYAALRTRGLFDAEGNLRRLAEDYRKLVMAQAVWSRELGLTPASKVAIKANSTSAALDLAGRFAVQDEDHESSSAE
jgi:hypothetical protein